MCQTFCTERKSFGNLYTSVYLLKFPFVPVKTEDTEIHCSKLSFLDPNFGVVWGFPFKPVSSCLACHRGQVCGCILRAPWKLPGINAYWNKPVCRCGHTQIYQSCQCRCTPTTATHVVSIHSSRFWRGFTSSLSHRVSDASILVYPIISFPNGISSISLSDSSSHPTI